MTDGGAQTRVVFSAWLDAERRCLRCDELYCERDNLGTHECAVHPLEHAPRNVDRTYRCCGREAGATGCCPADHIDAWSRTTAHKAAAGTASFAARNTLLLPGDRFAMLGETPSEAQTYVCAHSWAEHRGAGGGYEVQRVDMRRYYAARNIQCRALPSARAYY
jgi:hypothetical protein